MVYQETKAPEVMKQAKTDIVEAFRKIVEDKRIVNEAIKAGNAKVVKDKEYTLFSLNV